MENGKVTLCWPNYVGKAVLSGGAWSTRMPLEHLQSPTFAQVAESADATPGSTQFDITLPRSQAVGVLALANHNLFEDAEWRVRLWFDDAATSLAWDSDWVMVWPSVFATNELQWEDDNFWLGTFTEDERDSFTALATQFVDPVQIIRRITIEIQDSANPDGVVQIGRCFVGDVWQPEYNASYGIQYGHDIGTEFEVAGNPEQTEYADVRQPKRTVQFSLDHLSEEEGTRRLLAMQRLQGLHGEVLYAEGKDADTTSFSRTFIGRQESVSALTHPYFATYQGSVSLKEKL